MAAPSDLPLLSINDLVYEGAFRLPDDEFGPSSLNYSQGPLAYNPANHSIFIVGHGNEQAIAEFSIPPLVNSRTLTDLRMAGNPRQTFTRVISRHYADPLEDIQSGDTSVDIVEWQGLRWSAGDDIVLLQGTDPAVSTRTLTGVAGAGTGRLTLSWADPVSRSYARASSFRVRNLARNPQRIDRIGGLGLVDAPQGRALMVNTFEYYDNESDTHTTLALRNAADLPGSARAAVEEFYSFQGGPGHTGGWISPVPAEWRPVTGGPYITGMSSGWPIINRLSVGPSAFVFDPADITGNTDTARPVPTVRLMDFDLTHRLHDDLNNASLQNDLWTHLSFAVYGMIVPGTRTYLTLGHSGGHASGVCYKCDPDGRGPLPEYGGYGANDFNDYASYFWLWDVNDLVRVKEGQLASYAPRPYAYGTFSTPFSTPRTPLGGGSYDPVSGLLYLTVQRADRAQGSETNPPVVVAYHFNVPANALSPARPRRLRARP
jgi:hypothetical protein